jgi:hypothetical protein
LLRSLERFGDVFVPLTLHSLAFRCCVALGRVALGLHRPQRDSRGVDDGNLVTLLDVVHSTGAVHFVTVHFVTLHFVTVHFVTVHFVTVHFVTQYIHTYVLVLVQTLSHAYSTSTRLCHTRTYSTYTRTY